MAKSGLTIEVTPETFSEVADKVAEFGRKVVLEIDESMGEIAEEVKKVAQAKASAVSTQIEVDAHVIPGGAVVEGKSGSSPIAVLEEMGNKGNRRSKTFRHPVFGDMENWVDQPKHPYLRPAFRETQPGFSKLAERKLAEALKNSGFEVE